MATEKSNHRDAEAQRETGMQQTLLGSVTSRTLVTFCV